MVKSQAKGEGVGQHLTFQKFMVVFRAGNSNSSLRAATQSKCLTAVFNARPGTEMEPRRLVLLTGLKNSQLMSLAGLERVLLLIRVDWMLVVQLSDRTPRVREN